MKEEMVMAVVCREFKWTYEEYLQQPAYFIEIILEMLKAEAKEANKKKNGI